jgi:hypothetical protein
LDPEDLWQLSKADDSAVVLYISYLFCWLEKPPQPPEEALPMGQYVLTRNTVYGSVSNLSTVSRRGMSTLGASSGAGSPSVARRQNSVRISKFPSGSACCLLLVLIGASFFFFL